MEIPVQVQRSVANSLKGELAFLYPGNTRFR